MNNLDHPRDDGKTTVLPPSPDPSPEGFRGTAKKRNVAQKEADLVLIEKMSLRGASLGTITQAINQTRPYTLSPSMVHKDLVKLRSRWREESLGLITDQRNREIRKLEVLETELWAAWERSQRDDLERTMGKVDEDKIEGARAEVAAKAKAGRKTDTVKKLQRDGDVGFIGKLIDLHDRRVKLLGLASPERLEISGPDGAPIQTVQLTDEAQLAIQARHMERMKRAEQIPETRNENEQHALVSSSPVAESGAIEVTATPAT